MTLSLWQLQKSVARCLRSPEWIQLLGARGLNAPELRELAAWWCPSHFTGRWRLRWTESWIRGFAGFGDPYFHGKGGNFVAPLRVAWSLGRSERTELELLSRRPSLDVTGE